MLRGFVGFFAVGLAIVADRGLGLGPDRGKMGTDLSPLWGEDDGQCAAISCETRRSRPLSF